VTSAAIANGEITLVDLATNSVGANQIVDGSITERKLQIPPASTGKAIAMSIVFGG
jgi:hypothetical protein